MKISARDKKLLLILLALAVFCIPYFMVIKPMQEDNLVLRQQVVEAKERNRYLISLGGQENYYKQEAQKLAAEKEEILARFPEELPQEATILFLADLEKRIPISLMQVVYGQETAASVTSTEPVSESTEQMSVSEKEAAKTDAEIAEIEAAMTGGTDTQITTQTALTENMTGKCIASEYTYSVDYKNWKEFLYTILQEQNRMVITSLDAVFIESGKVEGSFRMNQYAIEGTGRGPVQIVEPELSNGTTNIFRSAAGKGSEAEEEADFFLMLNPPEAEVAAKIFGQAGDTEESTYLTSSSNDKQVIEIIFRGESGSYTAACTIGETTYEEEGIAFEKYGQIQLEILSTPRLGEDDKAGAVIHITNETDTTLGVRVIDDDTNDPRADIRTKIGAILMK